MIKLSLLQLGFLALLKHIYAPINCLPQDGDGGRGIGKPTGNLTCSVFKCQFPHPWVSILRQIHIPGAN